MTVVVRDRARRAWAAPTGAGGIEGSVAIGADGTIYVVTTDYSGADLSRLMALSPQGSTLWTLELPTAEGQTPAIGADGTLYLSAQPSLVSGSLFAVDPRGTVRWVLEDLERIRSSPAIGPDGTVYVAGRNHLYAVDPRGRIRWTYETSDPAFFQSSPAVASDGTIYIGGEDTFLHAINADGSRRWLFKTNGRIRTSPSIGSDGTIYFGSFDGRLYAVRPDGTERWSLELIPPGRNIGIQSSASIGADGTIYVVGDDAVAVDPGGSIRWRYPAGGSPTPILGADGTVYVGTTALDAQGRLLWEYGTGGWIFGSTAIGIDGRIIAASFVGPFAGSPSSAYVGTVHAIVEKISTNGGYAGAPWPSARGNRANNGRAGG
jgi:outer membrane protein assembly factor BamB